MKTECWQLRSIGNNLAVDKKACEKIFSKLTALTKFIHNIEGIIIELRIIFLCLRETGKYIKTGERMWGKTQVADLRHP